MPTLRAFFTRIAAMFGFALAVTLLAHAQGGPQNAEVKTAEQVYKNIQALKGTPAGDLIQSMHLICAALGVDCEFCHEEQDRAADTKQPKQMARKMILMMNVINQTNFGAKRTVTCYTCHRGSPEPANVPILPLAEPQEEANVALPSVDQILAKYLEALGGEEAIRKITSRVITGTQDIPTGLGGAVPVPAAIERDQKAPNLVVNFYHTPTYTIADGFDGTTAWSQDLRGRVTQAAKIDQLRVERDADFYLPLNLKKVYTRMEVHGIERVDGRDAYMVIGTPQGDIPEQLYFDTRSGLLLRKWAALPTPVGNSPSEVNYADYRDTGSGVKFPYLITMSPANPRTELTATATIRVTKVQDNAPVDGSKFAKPESKPTAAQ